MPFEHYNKPGVFVTIYECAGLALYRYMRAIYNRTIIFIQSTEQVLKKNVIS